MISLRRLVQLEIKHMQPVEPAYAGCKSLILIALKRFQPVQNCSLFMPRCALKSKGFYYSAQILLFGVESFQNEGFVLPQIDRKHGQQSLVRGSDLISKRNNIEK